MPSQTFLSQAKHNGESQFKSLRSDKVSFASDDKRTRADVHAGGRRFTHLMGMNPVDLGEYFTFPTRRVAHFKSCRFHHTERRDGLAAWILNNNDCCPMQLAVHKEIIFIHIPLN
jgi:hypothetical protein